MTDEEYFAILERWRAYIAERTTLGYRFYNKDHLGNIREVIDEDGVVCQKIDYYPFGTPFSSEIYAINAAYQPFKYNGKEFDMMHGLNTYDYGARQYHPLLPLWDRVDPLAEKYYSTSPYAYCLGNPVNYVDPDGKNPIYDKKGNFLGTDNTGLQGHYFVMDKKYFTQGMSNLDASNYAVLGAIPSDIENKINNHFRNLPNRPDYDGFVTVGEGISWAKSHPNALKNPTPDNTLYIDASKLDFGALSTSDFPKEGVSRPQNLFNYTNILESAINPSLLATVYALGRVNMILTDKKKGTVKIVNDDATYYDWNVGGDRKRDWFIRTNNALFGLSPLIHGFKTYYYGLGYLRK